LPHRKFPITADEQVFSIGEGMLHYLEKLFHYLAGFWFAHAELSLQAGDQFILGESHGLPLQDTEII